MFATKEGYLPIKDPVFISDHKSIGFFVIIAKQKVVSIQSTKLNKTAETTPS